jgi:Fe-S cluster assembly protein SufD
MNLNWDTFLKHGLPTRKDERWKYTDLTFLTNKKYVSAQRMEADQLSDVVHQHRLQHSESIMLVFVNGYFTPALSDLAKLPEGVIACSLNENLIESIDINKYPFVSLNAALFTDGLFLQLPDACEIKMPIHFLSLVMGDKEWMIHPRNMIILGENSHLTLAEEYFSLVTQAYLMNSVTTIHVGKNAKLDHCKIQQEGKQAAHLANTFIYQKQNSHVSFANFSSGGLFARDDVIVKLQESGAHCDTSGFYHLRTDNQYIDNHVDIDHLAPYSSSEMLYKGIIDKKSRAVFNGRLHVAKDAQKILAHQANHHLLLANDAEAYSKPELEIYADDVKCKHGATTGQLDQEALFYLCSRGIPRVDAVNMLLQGFSEEIMQRVKHPAIQMRVQETL